MSVFDEDLSRAECQDQISRLQDIAHRTANAKGFYAVDVNDSFDSRVAKRVALIHSELSEFLEAMRTQQISRDADEELADVAIRLFDLADFLGVDLGKEICRKMRKNHERPALHGKRF